MAKSLRLNAFLNATRQCLSILFPLITFPYVSRVLGNAEYGRYAFSSSVLSFFILIGGFGINNYAVREGARIRDDTDAITNFASDLFLINCFTVILALVLLFLACFFSPKLYSYKVLIIIQSFCVILNLVGMEWVNIVYEDFLYTTIRYIVIQIIALILIFLFIRSSFDTWKFCLITVFASYGGNIINLFYSRRYVKVKIRLYNAINFKKYFLPLFILFINSFATTVYVSSDITMLGLFMGDADVGVYSFSSKIYNIVKYFINAVMIVTVPRLAYLKEKEPFVYKLYVEKIIDILALFIFPVAVGLCMLGDSIIMVVGGHEYMEGVVSLKILSASLVFALFSSVFTNCILILNRQEKFCLISTIISALVNIVLNILLIPIIGIIGAAITTIIAEGINLIFQILFSMWKADFAYKFRFKEIGSVFFGACITFLSCYLINVFMPTDSVLHSAEKILLCVVISVILYFVFLIISKNDVVLYMLNTKKRY